jgi:alkanesulfonate monooxygenase SsuD/methylene tetrahydromethanopterin reductase-like flavin-dependent oxidoreductase (luciferase family)
MVLCPAFRGPTLTAKMIATLDDISGERLNVGIGACNFRGNFKPMAILGQRERSNTIYRVEYLEVIERALTSPEGFSFRVSSSLRQTTYRTRSLFRSLIRLYG